MPHDDMGPDIVSMFHQRRPPDCVERQKALSVLVSRIRETNKNIIIEKLTDREYKIYYYPSENSIRIITQSRDSVHYPIPAYIILSVKNDRLDVKHRWVGTIVFGGLLSAIAILVIVLLIYGIVRSGTLPTIRVILVQGIVVLFGVGIPAYFAKTIISDGIAKMRGLRRIVESANR